MVASIVPPAGLQAATAALAERRDELLAGRARRQDRRLLLARAG